MPPAAYVTVDARHYTLYYAQLSDYRHYRHYRHSSPSVHSCRVVELSRTDLTAFPVAYLPLVLCLIRISWLFILLTTIIIADSTLGLWQRRQHINYDEHRCEWNMSEYKT